MDENKNHCLKADIKIDSRFYWAVAIRLNFLKTDAYPVGPFNLCLYYNQAQPKLRKLFSLKSILWLPISSNKAAELSL